MLRSGNSKLGKSVWQWSIPANDRICIGATPECRAACYAKKGNFHHRSVVNALEENYRESLKKNFPNRIIRQIRQEFIGIVRLHVSGDFYSAEYTEKWLQIVRDAPRTLFFTYTRSWRDKDVYESLKKLARLPNMRMWFSCDRQTKAPPRSRYARRAFMRTDDGPLPYAADLIFRVSRDTVEKHIGGTLVCPPENGVTKTTCCQCRLCFRDEPVPSVSKGQPVLP